MRSVFGKVAALTVASVLATTAIVGCSSDPQSEQTENLGSVGMHLKVGPGITLNAVTMTITDTTHPDPVMVRTIPAPGDGSDFNFAVSLPPSPAGGHYHVHLEAHTTTPHAVTCLGDADFTVAAGVTNTISLPLVCDDDLVNGDQKFNVTVDSHVCPLYVDFASVSPTTVLANGGVATLSGTAHDETSGTFTYAWAAPAGSGTITDPNQGDGDATFTCGPSNSNVVLTLTATRTDQGCSDSISVWVNCASANCGNGVINSGETCDDGNTIDTDSCPADCTFACGDGKIEGNEQCENPNGVTCGTLAGVPCQLLPFCGDHIKNGTEECDDGNTADNDGCNHLCQTPHCGNAIKDQGEGCDDGNAVNGDGCETNCTPTPGPAVCNNSTVENGEDCDPRVVGKCTTMCKFVTSAACLACETANPSCNSQIPGCDNMTGNVTTTVSGTAKHHGEDFLNQAKALACNTVLECVRRTNCAAKSPTDCICGVGADATLCSNGDDSLIVPDDGINPSTIVGDLKGPCIYEIAGALSTKANAYSQLFSRFGDVVWPGGTAVSRVICDRTNCAGGQPIGASATTQCFAPPVGF